MSIDYSLFGGTLITPDHADAWKMGDPQGAHPVWNFGLVRPDAASEMLKAAGLPPRPRLSDGPSFYDLAPHLKGAGEGRTVVLNHLARKVTGSFLKSQYQNRGTCVSRGMKRVIDGTQVLAMYLGRRQEFKYASHALIYGACREYGHDLSYQDGAVGEWAAWAVENVGNLSNEDVSDDDNNDDLAVKWGARGVPSEIKQKAGAHRAKTVPIRSVEEARDFICSGQGFVTVASGIGYEGRRNRDGVVRIRGRWSHQMCFVGYRPDLASGGALLQNQSWGPDQPGGDVGSIELAGYEWWTLAEDAARQIAERDCFGVKLVDGWELADVSHRP